jgi:hypothetical protein
MSNLVRAIITVVCCLLYGIFMRAATPTAMLVTAQNAGQQFADSDTA